MAGADSIFRNFKIHRDKILDLNHAITALNEGYNRMNFILLKFVSTNARSSAPFAKATCDTENFDSEVYVAGSVFQKGIDVLEQYSRPGQITVPTDEEQRSALRKLLKYLSEDHDELFEEQDNAGNKEEWAAKVVLHLLAKLAVDNKYVMSPEINLTRTSSQEDLSENIGDTSFGCAKGWHGEVDIILEDNLTVQLLKDEQADSLDPSIDIAPNENFPGGDKMQLLAQTVVFSFLQQKYNKIELKNALIPAIGISTKQLCINLYDCENDVFLSSDPALQMFGRGRLLTEIVLLLWLTLNYRYFCTGITDEMSNCKAGFHRRVDDMISEYKYNVQRPCHLSDKPRKNTNWAAQRGKKVKRSFVKNEYYEL